VRRSLRRSAAATAALAVLWFGYCAARVVREPAAAAGDSLVVNDVTGLNPVTVARVLAPATVAEIEEAVRTHPGPIAIGGGRYSMGGQTASDGALHFDLRGFNRILDLDTARRTITVQAGARWRQLQEYLDPHDLSVMLMQTYSDFTVGGSLSVNSHGRYVGGGPVILSVASFRIVLPDGSLVEASPARNP
jgi:FAD/FMN-containing dehydrogenase